MVLALTPAPAPASVAAQESARERAAWSMRRSWLRRSTGDALLERSGWRWPMTLALLASW